MVRRGGRWLRRCVRCFGVAFGALAWVASLLVDLGRAAAAKGGGGCRGGTLWVVDERPRLVGHGVER
jgi:hypothetical protein